MTYGDAMAARILELEQANAKLRKRVYKLRTSREMWQARAMARTRLQRQS